MPRASHRNSSSRRASPAARVARKPGPPARSRASRTPRPSSPSLAERAVKPGQLVDALLPWFRIHARDLPWRRTLDPYAIWVSEIMLQQTQVKTVIPYWERWMTEFPSAAALASAPLDRVLKLWEGLGYYSRARNLQSAALRICSEHQGIFPIEADAVLDLPGIGRYTAGAIRSIAFNAPAPILDGNVMRVLCRVWAIDGDPQSRDTSEQLWGLATDVVEQAAQRSPAHPPALSGNCSALNQALMELGALVCTPRDPQCGVCPLATFCRARAQGNMERYPQKRDRAKATARFFLACVVESQGRIWVGRRSNGEANAGLWEFPSIELSAEAPPESPKALQALAGLQDASLTPLVTIKHSITRFRISTLGYATKIPGKRVPDLERNRSELKWSEARWVTAEELKALPFSAAHARLCEAWLQRGIRRKGE